MTRLLVPRQARDEIVALTEGSLTAETGGVLMGYVDEHGRAVVTRVTGPGPNAIRSAKRFHRDVPFVQAELDRAAVELGEGGAYLGEWHSHLVPDPQPSPTDTDSLFGIAEAPNYLNSSPVLIIAGLNPQTGRCVQQKAWRFPVGRGIDPLVIDEGD
ncbi:MAG: Mov34/MPN/PAD-1 family protein [Chloroflexota bacterium]|nr:Mov34/MPN/PAD-1 family protein [Chloroflexota bacterium]